jgi:hypothetical protein
MRRPLLAVICCFVLAAAAWVTLRPSPLQGEQATAPAVALVEVPGKGAATLPGMPSPSPDSKQWATQPPKLGSEQAKVWQQMARTFDEPFSVVRHRAAVTGNLRDIAAATAYKQRCLLIEIERTKREDGGIPRPERQLKLLEEMATRCANVNLESVKTVKDPAGYQGDPQTLLRAIATVPVDDSEERQKILALVRETKSATLLESVTPALVNADLLYELGLPKASGIDPDIDRRLAMVAIKIRACEERGDCSGMSAFRADCAVANQCVDDYRNYPAQRLFGAEADRALRFRSANLQGVTTEQLKQRWEQIQQLLRSRVY